MVLLGSEYLGLRVVGGMLQRYTASKRNDIAGRWSSGPGVVSGIPFDLPHQTHR